MLLLRGLKEELDTGSRVKSIGKIRPDFTPKVDLEAGKMSLSMRQPGLPGDEASELQSRGFGGLPGRPLCSIILHPSLCSGTTPWVGLTKAWHVEKDPKFPRDGKKL